MSNYAQIKEQLSNLKLAGIIETLEQRLKQADEGELAYTELLSLLLDDELELRRNRKIERLLTSAGLKGNQTLETFDFRANASINAVQVRELATLRFIEKAENVFLVGSTGVAIILHYTNDSEFSINCQGRNLFELRYKDLQFFIKNAELTNLMDKHGIKWYDT